MAPLALSRALLVALIAIASVSPLALPVPQEDEASSSNHNISDGDLFVGVLEAFTGTMRDSEFWCETFDTKDADAVVRLWEDGHESSGMGSPSATIEKFTKNEEDRDNWLFNVISGDLRSLADADIGNCGAVGAQCNPNPSCKDITEEYGRPDLYWIMRGIAGFQTKLNIAQDFLQNTVIDNILSLEEIADDFSEPESYDTWAELIGLISSAFFVGGGVMGVASSLGGIAAVNAAGFLGKASSEKARAIGVFENERTDKQLESAKRMDSVTGGGSRGLAAGGAGTYLIGSSFGLASANAPDDENQVSSKDLATTLRELFSSARENLELIGRLAVGDAREGEEYEWLPHQDSSGDTELTSPIAGFFGDGKMLLSATDITFNQTLEHGFGQFKTKIIDRAMVSAGIQLYAREGFDKDDCARADHPGYLWVDVDGDEYCLNLFREASSEGTEPSLIEEDVIEKLEDKYSFNLETLYREIVRCNRDGSNDHKVDIGELPAEGELPLCWFSISAWRYDANRITVSGQHVRTNVNYYDFDEE